MKTPSAFPRRQRTLWIICLLPSPLCLLPSAFPAPAPDPLIPGPRAADRYQVLAARSPFSPPTAEAPPPVATPTPPPPAWGEKYTLGGLAQFGAGYKVTLNPKNPVGAGATASAGSNNVNPTERLVIITGTPGPEGITLVGVQWNDDPKQTRATLLKNGVPAVFTFDPTALTAARGNAVTACSIPAPRSSASGPGVSAPPGGFSPPSSPAAGGAPVPGIVRRPNTRAPIRPPPPAPGPNGVPLVAPPPPPSAPIRVAPRSAPVVPGNTADNDDD